MLQWCLVGCKIQSNHPCLSPWGWIQPDTQSGAEGLGDSWRAAILESMLEGQENSSHSSGGLKQQRRASKAAAFPQTWPAAGRSCQSWGCPCFSQTSRRWSQKLAYRCLLVDPSDVITISLEDKKCYGINWRFVCLFLFFFYSRNVFIVGWRDGC